jgi:DNA-binding GntR family transcriptional regulator
MQAVDSQLERPRSLTELAEERIRSLIVTGAFALGEQLSEVQLAGRLGISKTPVREALLRLRHGGLVEIHPQRGTYVFTLDEAGLDHVCQFRTVIECEALVDAMKHRPAELQQALDGCMTDLKRAAAKGQWREFPRLDTEFHNALVRTCDNAYLKTAYELVASQVAALRYRLDTHSADVRHCQEEHATLVEAVREGDGRKARALLKAHIQGTRVSYLIACRPPVAAAA